MTEYEAKHWNLENFQELKDLTDELISNIKYFKKLHIEIEEKEKIHLKYWYED